MKEVLYERVTGRSEEVIILPGEPAPAQVRMTLRLWPDQRTALDDISKEIVGKTGATVSVAAIVRGVLDAVDAAKIDLTDCRSEAAVKAAVLARLTRR